MTESPTAATPASDVSWTSPVLRPTSTTVPAMSAASGSTAGSRAVRIGRKVRFDPRDLDRYIESQRVEAIR